MQFRVRRTSEYSNLVQPCEEAYQRKLPKFSDDHRSFKTFEEFDKQMSRFQGTWLSKGINHCITSGGIFRQLPQEGKGWYVKLGTMKDLQSFVSKYGECVVSQIDGEMSIEIYDDYRE